MSQGVPKDAADARRKKYEEYLAANKTREEPMADATRENEDRKDSDVILKNASAISDDDAAAIMAALDGYHDEPPPPAMTDRLIDPGPYHQHNVDIAQLMIGGMSPEDAAAIAQILDQPTQSYSARKSIVSPKPVATFGKKQLDCHNCRRGADMFVSFFCKICKTMVVKTLRAIEMHGPRCSNTKCGKMSIEREVFCHVIGCDMPYQIQPRSK